MPAPVRSRPTRPPSRRDVRRAARCSIALLAGATTLGALAGAATAAQAPVGLGVASSFAVLSGSAVTNVGPSTLGGDLGVSPGTAVSGFPPGLFDGVLHAADAVAAQAQADVTQAFGDAASRTPPLLLTGDLGGRILTPGVYRAPSSIGLTGTLTLDAQGDPSAVFVVQVGSTLTTASASRVALINGAQPCNVTWQIGSSATLGSASSFAGNLLAAASISLDDAVTVRGRLLARSGAVTLINDTVVAAPCATDDGPTGPGVDGGAAPAAGGGTAPPTGTSATSGNPTGPQPAASSRPDGTATLTTTPRQVARTIGRYGTGRCVRARFRAEVTGLAIRRVTFTRDGRTIATRNRAPYAVTVNTARGVHRLRARVTFTNGAAPVSLSLRFRSCGPTRATASGTPPGPASPGTPSGPGTPSRPPRTPGGFAG